MRDYRPFKLFLSIALVFLFFSVLLAGFLLVHYIHTGEFTPHKWAGFTAGFLGFLASTSLMLGFILDMFARMRINQEEMLYYLKKNSR